MNKSHLDAEQLGRQNPSLSVTGVLRILRESADYRERKRSNPEQIKVLIDNVLLAVKMNNILKELQRPLKMK